MVLRARRACAHVPCSPAAPAPPAASSPDADGAASDDDDEPEMVYMNSVHAGISLEDACMSIAALGVGLPSPRGRKRRREDQPCPEPSLAAWLGEALPACSAPPPPDALSTRRARHAADSSSADAAAAERAKGAPAAMLRAVAVVITAMTAPWSAALGKRACHDDLVRLALRLCLQRAGGVHAKRMCREVSALAAGGRTPLVNSTLLKRIR
jgi:hypothetical protein